MSTENLTSEQKAFLEECKLEFSDRFTDADIEFKKIYDLGIPPPPIMCPWYIRNRYNNRDRAGGSRYHDYKDRSENRGYNNTDYHNRGYQDYGDRRY